MMNSSRPMDQKYGFVRRMRSNKTQYLPLRAVRWLTPDAAIPA
jgi:hypothetical protein